MLGEYVAMAVAVNEEARSTERNSSVFELFLQAMMMEK